MKSTPPQPLRLRPEIGDLPQLIAYIQDFARLHNITPADAQAFTLAAEELFANTLNHSIPPATTIDFTLTLPPREADPRIVPTTLTAIYSDDAPPFDPTLHPAPDTTLPAALRMIGGLGIHLIRTSMPTFRYARIANRNVITFGRTLSR